MKFYIYILTLFTLNQVFAQKKETINIPNGVVYKYASPKLVEKAKKLIEENLKDKKSYDLTDDLLIIGPILWKRFSNDEKLNSIKGGNVDLHVDDQILKGKMTQSIEDTKLIWDALRNEIGTDFKIRKANEFELNYYWSVISFDIEEPLLIVETKEHKYILNLIPDNLKLMWLDEVPIASNESVIYKNGTKISTLEKGNKETALESIKLLNTDAELSENTTIEDLTSIIDQTKTIFNELFMKSEKSGKIMVYFELTKENVNISFAIKNDVDLDLMRIFEKKVLELKLPKSKKDPIKFDMLFKINEYNETN